MTKSWGHNSIGMESAAGRAKNGLSDYKDDGDSTVRDGECCVESGMCWFVAPVHFKGLAPLFPAITFYNIALTSDFTKPIKVLTSEFCSPGYSIYIKFKISVFKPFPKQFWVPL